MAQAAAKRPAIAHRTIGDIGGDLAHPPVGRVGNLAVLDLGVGDRGAQGDRLIAFLKRPQLIHHRQVYERPGRATEVEHTERLISGDEAGAGFRAPAGHAGFGGDNIIKGDRFMTHHHRSPRPGRAPVRA